MPIMNAPATRMPRQAAYALAARQVIDQLRVEKNTIAGTMLNISSQTPAVLSRSIAR